MSKPPIASELLTKTPIVKLEPTVVALKVRGTCGQLKLDARVRQIAPVRRPCAGCVEKGLVRKDASIKSAIATSFFID